MRHGLNEKGTSFQTPLHTKSRLSSHSNSSPMEGKTFQKGMSASSEETFMQELLEQMEAWGEVLEKIITCLSKIEEELKEGEEQDEGDKADYEQSELTQGGIDQMMTKGKVHLLLPNFMPQLKSAPKPWTFKRAHINDFSKLGDIGS